MANVTVFLQRAFHALLSTGVNMQGSHQQLKEEPGVLEDCFSHHSSADHHLQSKLLVEMLHKNHKNQSVLPSVLYTNTSFLFINCHSLLVTDACVLDHRWVQSQC